MKGLLLFIVISAVHIESFSFDFQHPLANISFRPIFNKLVGPRSCECGKPSVSRIIGGTEAPKLKYPWITALCRSSKPICGYQNQFCGGTLINNMYVLTAAHCVDGQSAGAIIVNVGDWDLNSTSEVPSMQRNVSQIIKHKSYNSRTIENDIALLKLSSPIVFSDEVKPICLPISTINPPSFADDNATVIGWGQTDPIQHVYPTILREVVVEVLTNNDCIGEYGRTTIKSSMICASGPNKDSCYGDSGGPMLIKDPVTLKSKIIGIVSFGNGCASPKYAGVYTRVTSFLKWIADNMEGAEQCS